MAHIYEDEGLTNKLVRKRAIEAALHETTEGIINRKKVPDHAPSVRAVAKLLSKIESYDTKNGFDDGKNTAYYAQQMAIGFERELRSFLKDTQNMEKNSHDYNQRISTFNDSCHQIIVQNIEGVSREPTFWNFIAPAINAFLKLIGAEPYKLDTTSFAKNLDIREGLRELKDTGIGKDKIEEVDRGNEYTGPG